MALTLPTGKGDITNPRSWQDNAGHVPPSVFDAVPATTNYPLNGDGRYWFQTNMLADSPYTVELHHFDGLNGSTAITDDSLLNEAFAANGNGSLDTSTKQFGTASLFCNSGNATSTASGATGPFTTAGGPFDFGSGDFTLEGWYCHTGSPSSNPSQQIIWADVNSSINRGHRVYTNDSSGSVTLTYQNFDNSGWLTSGPVIAFAAGTWHHWAVVKKGNQIGVAIDGVFGSINTFSNATAITFDATSRITVGYDALSSIQHTYFYGHLDEIRISKGIARYPLATFVVPVVAFGIDPPTYNLAFIGDPNYLTGEMVLTWQLTALSNDGSVPNIVVSLDNGATYTYYPTKNGLQGLQSGTLSIPITGVPILIGVLSLGGTFSTGATYSELAVAITRNENEGPIWDFPNPIDPTNYNADRLDINGFPSATLAALRTRIMIRLGFANQAANPPPGMAPLVNEFLSSAQAFLYRRYVALHTRRWFRWKMVPGQRFYSLKDNDEDVLSTFTLDPNKTIEHVAAQDNRNVWWPLIKGIPPNLYTMLNKPWRPARYDIRGAIEIYPVPDQTYWLWIKGDFGLLSFTADGDTTTIDSELVFLHALANAKAHYGQGDANNIEAQANAYRKELVAGSHATGHYVPATVIVPPAVRPTLVNFQDNSSG